MSGPLCPKCGARSHGLARPCWRCRRRAPAYKIARSAFRYSGAVRSAILELKFEGRHSLAKGLGFLLHSCLKGEAFLADAGAIAFVPLHPSRKRFRGYDQAYLLAMELARLTGKSLIAKGLKRIRETSPQAGLRARERFRNVRDAFVACEPSSLANAAVILVDDVMTTGATADAAARALIDGGAREVSVATLARD